MSRFDDLNLCPHCGKPVQPGAPRTMTEQGFRRIHQACKQALALKARGGSEPGVRTGPRERPGHRRLA